MLNDFQESSSHLPTQYTLRSAKLIPENLRKQQTRPGIKRAQPMQGESVGFWAPRASLCGLSLPELITKSSAA
jgi:hypothetical protein